MKKSAFTLLFVASAIVSGFSQTKIPANIEKLLQKNTCLACHNPDRKIVGPSYKDVAKKKYTAARIVELIAKPNPGNWPGYPPMAAMANVPKNEATTIAKWITTLK